MLKKKKTFNYLFILLAITFASCGSSDNGSEDGEMQEIVKDNISPVISCPESITLNVDVFTNETQVNYTTPVGTDNLDGAVTTQTAGLPSGGLFPVGTTINTFSVKDAAGNTSTCSFDVIVTQDEASENMPYFISSNPTPSGKKWAKLDNMSDEFNGTTFDDAKWHRNPSTDGFGWIGRFPGLFESDNVTVADGNLNITTEKFTSPKNVNRLDWTHGGAIVRSKEKAKQGNFYECRMKANKTIMSSTFWISFKQNCSTGPVRKLELDIQECVGRVHSNTADWAKDYANVFASNTWRHNRSCDTAFDESKQSPSKTVLTEENNSRYFVYGCWWKSSTEILFYLDGELTHSILNPPADFDLEGHLTMAIETYDWNPVNPDGDIFNTGSFDDLTTKYDWIRSWKLENL